MMNSETPIPGMGDTMLEEMKQARLHLSHATCSSCAAFVPRIAGNNMPYVRGMCCLRSIVKMPSRFHSDWCLEHVPLKGEGND